eukprot:7387003-Prymnesium_polylepis.1
MRRWACNGRGDAAWVYTRAGDAACAIAAVTRGCGVGDGCSTQEGMRRWACARLHHPIKQSSKQSSKQSIKQAVTHRQGLLDVTHSSNQAIKQSINQAISDAPAGPAGRHPLAAAAPAPAPQARVVGVWHMTAPQGTWCDCCSMWHVTHGT